RQLAVPWKCNSSLTALYAGLLHPLSWRIYFKHLRSFPTRRSSDLDIKGTIAIGFIPQIFCYGIMGGLGIWFGVLMTEPNAKSPQDRKSTRLNSSHVSISYAVFSLKKKKSSTG